MMHVTAVRTNILSSQSEVSTLTLRLASFLVGFAVALVACSLTGYRITSHNIFLNFNRFHPYLAPESDFLPTARQVRQLAFATLDKSKLNVVIGGSSVFYGVGQPLGATITDDLRRELGDDYRVIDLAMRSGDLSGIAELTVEMLIREGYKVVYLADIGVARDPAPIGSAPYQYFFWDAKARGYIMDWPLRGAVLGQYAWLSDKALGGWLNSLMNFNELWSTIGYERVFTVFSILMPGRFWRPRREFPDDELSPPLEKRYPYDFNNEMRIVESISRLYDSGSWKRFERAFDVAIRVQCDNR